MSATFVVFASLSIAVTLLIAAGLAYYIRASLRSGAAIGLGWDFLRDQEPIRYWLQLGVVAFIALDQVAKAVAGVIKFSGMI